MKKHCATKKFCPPKKFEKVKRAGKLGGRIVREWALGSRLEHIKMDKKK